MFSVKTSNEKGISTILLLVVVVLLFLQGRCLLSSDTLIFSENWDCNIFIFKHHIILFGVGGKDRLVQQFLTKILLCFQRLKISVCSFFHNLVGIFNWKCADNFTLPLTSQMIWSIYTLSLLSLSCIFLVLLSFCRRPPQSIFCVHPFLTVLHYVPPLSSSCVQLLSEVLKDSFCNGLFPVFPTDPFCFSLLWCWEASFPPFGFWKLKPR